MKSLEALKRLRQETAPATYMEDFDKEECCNVIEKELKALEIIKTVCPNIFWVVRTRTFKEYKKKCDDDTLLEEEYYLLKEVLQ